MSANNEQVDSNKIVDMPKEEQSQQQQEQQQQPVTFECPVCYTNGATTGIVTPVCGHQLCLGCYSTMLVNNQTTNKCPCCRRKYLNTGIDGSVNGSVDITDISSQDADDPYADMPALIPQPIEQYGDLNNDISYALVQQVLMQQQPVLADPSGRIGRLSDNGPAITLNTIIDLINEINLAASSASAVINDAVPAQRSMY